MGHQLRQTTARGCAPVALRNFQDIEHGLRGNALDAIVANPIGGEGSAYGGTDSEATLLWPGGRQYLGRRTKTEVAAAILDLVGTLRNGS